MRRPRFHSRCRAPIEHETLRRYRRTHRGRCDPHRDRRRSPPGADRQRSGRASPREGRAASAPLPPICAVSRAHADRAVWASAGHHPRCAAISCSSTGRVLDRSEHGMNAVSAPPGILCGLVKRPRGTASVTQVTRAARRDGSGVAGLARCIDARYAGRSPRSAPGLSRGRRRRARRARSLCLASWLRCAQTTSRSTRRGRTASETSQAAPKDRLTCTSVERTTGFEPATLTLANRPEQISDLDGDPETGSDLP